MTAVGVVDDRTLLAATRGHERGSVLLHRVTGGTATLVAGRNAAGRTGPERLAADEPPDTEVPAVDVDLDPVGAVVALPGGDALVVTAFRDTGLPKDYPQRLTLFVLHGDTPRRLPVDNLFAGPTLPVAVGSVLDDRTVVLEARRATGERGCGAGRAGAGRRHARRRLGECVSGHRRPADDGRPGHPGRDGPPG